LTGAGSTNKDLRTVTVERCGRWALASDVRLSEAFI
jgi:hypothetical protein